jgi:ribA/ribD-fused uncharacterized protein
VVARIIRQFDPSMAADVSRRIYAEHWLDVEPLYREAGWFVTYDKLGGNPVPEDIRFYRASERPFGIFSNLFRRDMVFEGRTFYCAEAAYQIAKPRKQEVRDWLMAAPSPSLLAGAAHALLPWDIAPGWSQGRYSRMRAVVEAKFRQHPDLAEILLSTGDARLVEFTTIDNPVNRRWGEVLKGKGCFGENHLGRILMEVRAVLASERRTNN